MKVNNEERYRNIFENASIAMWEEDLSEIKTELEKLRAGGVKDLRTFLDAHPEFLEQAVNQVKIIAANQAMLNLFEVKKESDVLGNLGRLVSPDEFKDELIAFAENQDSLEKEFTRLTLRGQIRTLLQTVTYYSDTAEKYKALVQVTDITALKQADEKLRQLSRAVEQSPATIVITDTRGNIQYVNPKFTQTTGYSAEEVMGQNPRILKSGYTSPDEYKRVWETITAGNEWRGEFHNKKKNGELYWEAVSISPIFDDHGKITHFLGIKEEITSQKQVEENLRKTEMQYRTLAEQIPPIVYMAGTGQHIGVTYVSPRIEMLGFSQEEWIADPELWLRQIHSDDRENVKEIIEESRNSGKPFKAEYRIRTRDGMELWFLDEAMDIPDFQGNVQFRQGFMLDITERKEAERSLSSHTRFVVLTNMATESIIGSRDSDDSYYPLITHLTNMFVADYAYLIRLDDSKKQATLIATTKATERPFSPIELDPEETESFVEMSQFEAPRIVENVQNSSYPINPSPFKDIARQTKSAIIIPLTMKDYCFGVVILAFDTWHRFSREEITYGELAGSQITLALRTVHQQREIETQLKEAKTLSYIERALSESERVGTDKILQLIVDSALDLIDRAEESVIHLIDPDEEILVPRAISGFNAGRNASNRHKIGMREGVAGQVISTGKTINVGDINADPLFVIKDTPPIYRSLLVSPVQSGTRQIGTISVHSNTPNAFSADDVELLNSLSIQAAIALENTRLFETTQQSLREVNALYQTGQELASSLNTDELIANVVNILKKTFGYYHAQIYLLDPASGELILKKGSGEVGGRLLEMKHRLPAGMGIVGHVAEMGTPFATNNVNDIMFFYRNPLLPDTLSELAVPIKVDGNVVGVVDIQDKPPHRLTDNDIHLVSAVADQLSIALQKASLYENLQTSLKQEQTVRSQLIQSERLALVGRLLASVSHELNNPLQAIQNALFLLKGEEQLSAQGRQDLDVILSEAERMASLIERLRTAYRPGRVRDFRPVDLNNLIEDVHTLIATFLRQKKIAFELHPESDLPPVSGMSDQMRQVVLNLFLNAIDAMKPGGRLIVRTRHLAQQNEVLLSVKDTGPGIDPEILPKIFDAFITNKQTGTGLGLTITRDIIEQHFGHIEAENDPEGGAIFNVWLPIDGKGQA